MDKTIMNKYPDLPHNQWLKVMYYIQYEHSEGEITDATYQELESALMDLKNYLPDTALLEKERAEGIKLTPSLKQELERMNEKGQDTLAWLLYYASAMGDYGDPCGVWAVVSPDSGKVLVTEKDCPELAQKGDEGK